MENTADRAIAIVGAGAVLPDARNVAEFWENVKGGRDSIREVPSDRWSARFYYDPDRSAPDKTYSKIGGWVREYSWDPIAWKMPVPPRVADAMDEGQKWAVACTREALRDYGHPERFLDPDRTAVILGNAMGGERHYKTSLRVFFPEYANELEQSEAFSSLPVSLQHDITRELRERISRRLPPITEDTMPGELANCIAGRVANLFNFHGPNFVTDAACASAMAAISAAADGLIEHDFDVAITGGIDHNMGAPTFVKFSKIGALSATGSRPYAEGADGFVMGEGAAIFILKRLADAEHDGDRIHAVLRGIGGSSDGRGKGITAPNPAGQKLCLERAWQNAGLSPATATLFEGHGTSTTVGDVVEANALSELLANHQLPQGSVALGSVKSNIGHLKAAAGAAGILKTTLALRDKVLPPSVHCETPNPEIDFAHSALYVNRELKPWTDAGPDGVRRAGVSAFGFGGTNFHAVLEEYIPHHLHGNGRRSATATDRDDATSDGKPLRHDNSTAPDSRPVAGKAPLRGALVVGAPTTAALAERLRSIHTSALAGVAAAPAVPDESDLRATERIAIDYADAAELADKAGKALKSLETDQPATWKALRAQGIFRGSGPAPKVAFLYTGQGSQYVNMLRPLHAIEPIVADTFAEADRIMLPLLGKPLSDYVFVDPADPDAVAKSEDDLRQTAITQPAVLAVDAAFTRLLAAYGIEPDMVMGHSLGEYGALVASGGLPFDDALEAVSARGRGMTDVAGADNGRMAAVFAPLQAIEQILATVEGYMVIANVNSNKQAVIGGASQAVQRAIEAFQKAGYEAVPLPVSHAFHTSIVAAASGPLRRALDRLRLRSPRLPIVANVSGEFYPSDREAMLDILGRQVASPVQFVKGLETLYGAGARVFVEVGPKKALQGFAEDVLGNRPGVLSLFTNHPKIGDVIAFNQALCGLYSAGLGRGDTPVSREMPAQPVSTVSAGSRPADIPAPRPPSVRETAPAARMAALFSHDQYSELGRMLAGVFERAGQMAEGHNGPPTDHPPVITGAALGLPGTERIFDEGNVARILRGEQMIGSIPDRLRRDMLDKHITRLVKSDNGGAVFQAIDSVNDVVKLAGRGGAFDLEKEFGIPAERVAAFDRVTQLAMAAGLDAMRDAGIPLVLRYKTTTTKTQLPDRWGLPDAMREDTGVILASVFAGYNTLADETSRCAADHARREQLALIEDLQTRMSGSNAHSALAQELDRRYQALRSAIEAEPYSLDRRFLLRVLTMGHSQFAEYIGARGPNTAVNAACASTTHAVGLAQDWIRAGRCRRVIIVSADDITSDQMIGWFGAGFLASGAAATDEVVEEAATPFDRRRHGMIMGMGAAALVIESAEAARERGIRPICEILNTSTANSAFHPTRLDVEHISGLMEQLVAGAEIRGAISRRQMAERMVFVSHETYTPARGGSASAEIHALRHVFGEVADRIVIANTKGLTGHAMGAGLEDVLAVKALETGLVPPVPNFKEVDPELGLLNISKGGAHPIEYALRFGAGFGSQIAMTLMHWIPTQDGVRPGPNELGYASRISDATAWSEWLTRMAGHPAAQLEVVNRTLRVKDVHGSVRVPEPTPMARVEQKLEEPRPASLQPAGDPVKDRVLALVAEKTGYPTDMLDLDLDLEADLGIDTVKQAEVFASVREAYGIDRDTNLRLRDFPTLAHVIQFVKDRVPETVEQSAPPATTLTPGDPFKERVLEIVAGKTGYPKDMLDLDLDLEADLGIDTVKQAEVFAAIRSAYNIPRDENLKLRDFPTLAHVVRFARERRPDLAVALAPPAPPASVQAGVADPIADPIKERVLEIVAEKTGYPKDMLDLDLDLEADLGIDTVKQAEVFAAVRSAYDIQRDEILKLRDFPTLASVIRFARERRPDLAVAPAPPSAPASVQASAADPSADSIKDRVLNIVAEKTGYPKDMLDLDLDLEADLGIDTVKQAEMFAAIRSAYNIPRDENLKLRDFPTLTHVIGFARERATAAAPAKVEEPLRTPLLTFDAADRVPRRVPVPCWRPALDFFKPTGVCLAVGARVALMPDQGGVADALEQQLRASGVEVVRLDPAAPPELLVQAGPIQGLYWLPALDQEGSLSDLDLAAWRLALQVRVKSLFGTMRVLYDQIASPETFLIAATRLGGHHGYDEAGASSPLGGAVAGFTKAYKRERPEALVKVVDFGPGRAPDEIAGELLGETRRDSGALEIGYKHGERWTIGLREAPAADGGPGLKLDRDTVLLVTGAAGSIVSAITADLATASGGTFYLLDLAPEPVRDNPDLARFQTDKECLKRDLFARIQARGQRATPALVEKELAALERAQAAQSAIDAISAAGGAAFYFSVNLTDAEAVASVVQKVRERSGKIDVLIHAAGTERSHFLPDKDAREFDLVFDVKSDGWFNLMHAVGDMPLQATVAFSSIAGRFGNGGQTDYSAANDLLCKIASSFKTTRPCTRGIVIDWTAWNGIGMASRGSIPKMMELAGIDMLSPEAGIPIVRRELTEGGTKGEVVIAQHLGILMNELDPTGGLDPAVIENLSARGPMFGEIGGLSIQKGLTIRTTLDPTVQAFLFDHQIEHTPVLPGVMGIEAFAEAAATLLPGWFIDSIEDVNFLAPFKFYRNEPRTLTIQALFHPDGDSIVAECKLIGYRSLPNQPEAQETVHFTARVRMAKQKSDVPAAILPSHDGAPMLDAGSIYRVYFHGPAYRVIERAWQAHEQMIGQMAEDLPDNHCPPERPLQISPRLIELCFQTAGLWELTLQDRMGLPRHAGRVRCFRTPESAQGPLYAVVHPDLENGSFDADVVDSAGNLYMRLQDYRTVALSGTVDTTPLRSLHAAEA